jgi:type I site-specific restriction endonuclease
LASEHRTRKQIIDGRLAADGWHVVCHNRWAAGDRTPSNAFEELTPDAGRGDYLLFLDNQLVADVEARRPEVHPENVIEQAKRYCPALEGSPFRSGAFRIRNRRQSWRHATPEKGKGGAIS